MSPNEYTAESASGREFQHFLEGVIHSFRARLRDVATSAGFLSQKSSERLDEEGRGWLRAILDGVGELDGFTRALADYALALGRPRIEGGPMPVENALENAKAALRKRIQESSATIYSGPMPKLQADQEQLSTLFRCLLSNALEYTSGLTTPRIEITATAADDQWRFAVSDNGIGIAPRFHSRVFEPFERLHGGRRGVGLGLAIARRIVKAHGGRLWVDSQEGEGSTFFFTLPKISPLG